jgi:hypothetical protein
MERADFERREPRCRICRDEAVRVVVNELLAWSPTQISCVTWSPSTRAVTRGTGSPTTPCGSTPSVTTALPGKWPTGGPGCPRSSGWPCGGPRAARIKYEEIDPWGHLTTAVPQGIWGDVAGHDVSVRIGAHLIGCTIVLLATGTNRRFRHLGYTSAIGRSTVFPVRVIECALRQQILDFTTAALPPHTARRAG